MKCEKWPFWQAGDSGETKRGTWCVERQASRSGHGGHQQFAPRRRSGRPEPGLYPRLLSAAPFGASLESPAYGAKGGERMKLPPRARREREWPVVSAIHWPMRVMKRIMSRMERTPDGLPLVRTGIWR